MNDPRQVGSIARAPHSPTLLCNLLRHDLKPEALVKRLRTSLMLYACDPSIFLRVPQNAASMEGLVHFLFSWRHKKGPRSNGFADYIETAWLAMGKESRDSDTLRLGLDQSLLHHTSASALRNRNVFLSVDVWVIPLSISPPFRYGSCFATSSLAT